MEYLTLVVSGLMVGVAVAAPIGPVNLICIRRTLRFGAVNGFVSGAGAAIGDGLFATIAAFGVTAAIAFIKNYAFALQLVGGLFLIGLGIKTWLAHPHLDDAIPEKALGELLPVIGSTFVLTITNPATMLGFMAIFGGIAGFAVGTEDYGRASLLVASVVAGSALWWGALTFFVSRFRTRMSDRMLEIINHVSAALIILFGAAVLCRIVWERLF
ncbi:LysE family translocator [Tepidicaulis sp. LMO-SS28]|uniref:LysE family translocator n=1 Tax=Tepidicaulis sp. LMO-SS28 TaxID=3447455 RepID=UPI003EDF81F9